MPELGDLDDCYVTLDSGKRARVGWSDPAETVQGKPFNLCVGQGEIPGYWYIDKFGENPSIDTGDPPVDIWEVGGLYNYDAINTAPIVSLISTSSSDTEDIEVTGLDIDGNAVTQVLTLTGDTRVALTTPLWRVYRLENIGSVDLVGTIHCYIGTGGAPTDANTRARISIGGNQTLMALSTVPLGKVGFLLKGELGISRPQTAGEARCAYYSRRVGKVFKIKKRINVTNQGSSLYQDERSIPDVIPALTDIKLTVEFVSANSMGAWGAYIMYIVDEDKLAPEFLAMIGQPTSMPT